MGDSFRDALAKLEQALAEALETVTAVGTPTEIEKFVRLLIKKKIVTEMLLDKIDTLATYGNSRPPDPIKVRESSNQPGIWDQLMNSVKNGTKAELETTRNYQRFIL